MIKMNENMLKKIVIDTIKGEQHLGENLKNLCVDYIEQQENKQLKEDLKTLWIALWNNDTEMTSKQSETFDKYYEEFHKKESD